MEFWFKVADLGFIVLLLVLGLDVLLEKQRQGVGTCEDLIGSVFQRVHDFEEFALHFLLRLQLLLNWLEGFTRFDQVRPRRDVRAVRVVDWLRRCRLLLLGRGFVRVLRVFYLCYDVKNVWLVLAQDKTVTIGCRVRLVFGRLLRLRPRVLLWLWFGRLRFVGGGDDATGGNDAAWGLFGLLSHRPL